jgi:N-acetylmuramic acid 6-phosphate etherase
MTGDNDGLARLATEHSRHDFVDLDQRSTLELVQLMNELDATVAGAVGAAATSIAGAVDAIAERLAGGGRLIYVGAGTAGRLAAMDAVECGPTFGIDRGTVIAIVAGGAAAFSDALEGDEDDEQAAEAALTAQRVSGHDVVVSISASGRTPFAIGAARYARSVGAFAIGISCNVEAELSHEVDAAIEIGVGPEFIAGSTRLKSGTAQKLVLNMLSTLAMVRLGRTYGNWMVGVQANNEKLRARARRILVEATGLSESAAAGMLTHTDHDVRVALVMALTGADIDEARSRLAATGGAVRAALTADRAAEPRRR